MPKVVPYPATRRRGGNWLNRTLHPHNADIRRREDSTAGRIYSDKLFNFYSNALANCDRHLNKMTRTKTLDGIAGP